MTIRTVSAIVLSAVFASIGLRSALAAPNFFTPISGAQFVSTTNSPNVLYTSFQEIYSRDTQASQGVEASLGIAQGGANGFTIYGSPGPMGTVPACSVRVKPFNSTSFTTFTGTTSFTNGFFTTSIQTNLGAGNYFYFVSCNLAPSPQPPGAPARIIGVKPNQ